MDRVVPADTDQGAWEAGCGDFLIRLLEDDLVDRELYRSGLDSLDKEANELYQNSFDKLTSDEQDDLLTSVEVGSVFTRWSVFPGLFFRTLVKNTMEGYYGSSRNGGNRDGLAWQMIGFEVTG